jgi:hypothetical protein
MKTVYSEQAVIRVWRNLKIAFKLPTSHFGHASITVAGMNVKTTEDSPAPHTQHISFWPGEGRRLPQCLS